MLCRVVPNASGSIKEFVGGAFSCQQSTFLEAYLDKGTYLLYGEVDGNEILQSSLINGAKLCNYNISTYSENPISMELATGIQVDGTNTISSSILNEMMIKYIRQSPPELKLKWNPMVSGQVTRHHGTAFGHVFIYHQNDSTNVTYMETQEFITLKNLVALTPSTSVELPPGAHHLVLFTIGNLDNCSHKIMFSSKSVVRTQLGWDDLITQTITEGQSKKRQKNLKEINVHFY
jgi:hypothetical protein